MNAPERIWATGQNAQPSGRWWHETELKNGVEYIRADTVTARISQLEGMVVSGQGEQIRLAADLLQAKIEASTRLADAEAMAEALRGAEVKIQNLINVMGTPDQRQCCDGRECGCMGATVYQESEYYAGKELKAVVAALEKWEAGK